jgi:hypothetical protein
LAEVEVFEREKIGASVYNGLARKFTALACSYGIKFLSKLSVTIHETFRTSSAIFVEAPMPKKNVHKPTATMGGIGVSHFG